MGHPFDGIEEKLKRADQNIRNLDSEMASWIQSSDYPTIPNDNIEVFQKAVDYHAAREMPLRFSVLAGEVVHHLRSCLDHLAWAFSSTKERTEHPTRIEFPVFGSEPSKVSEF